MKTVVCFGEIMARLSPPGFLRLRQSMPGQLEVTFAGAEANAAASIALLGGSVEFVTALPTNELAVACIANLRSIGIGVRHIKQSNDGRFGLYFVETGANHRAGLVLYDREETTFAVDGGEYPWREIFGAAGWFHTTGISPGISQQAAGATLGAIRAAATAGLMVSFDLNHRRKLWRWDESMDSERLASRTLGEILPLVRLVIGNPADLALAAGLDPLPGDADLASIKDLIRKAVGKFPNLGLVALTLRQNPSANHNNFGAILYQAAHDRFHLAPEKKGSFAPYEIHAMVDRIGTGDAFAGALIYALQKDDCATPGHALEFAVAAGCLAHSIKGDFNFSTRAEIEALMQGNNGGAVSR